MFKENFVRICAEKGLSPSNVCIEAGISKSNYSNWNESSVPRKTTLIKIAQILNVDVSELTSITYEEKKGEAKSLLGDLTPEEIKKVQEYIVFLKSQRKK